MCQKIEQSIGKKYQPGNYCGRVIFRKFLLKIKWNLNVYIIKSFLKRYTMDTIWNCAYGIDINSQDEPENKYFHAAEKVNRLFE